MDDKVIALLRSRGPLLPSDIARQLRTNTFFAGAHLSALLESRKVRVSSIRIGSSPLYYLEDHKFKLESFADHLDQKDKRTFDLLKQKKILKDKDQDPLTRVSLRNIKDFAVQLNVKTANSQEIFWKFYSVSDEETNKLIKESLEPPIIKQQPAAEKQLPEEAPKEVKQEQLEMNKEKPRPEIKKTDMPKEETHLEKEVKHTQQKPILKEKPRIKEHIQEKLVQEPVQQKKEIVQEKQIIKGEFYDRIIASFAEKNIIIENIEMVKNNKEYDFTIRIPSPAGELAYYCKAKCKKRVNEGDLSSAVLKAQSKRLPALFLTDGDLTKKAEKSLNEEMKDQINIMKL